MATDTKQETLGTIKHFERIIKPQRMAGIKTQTLDDYVSHRQTERGRKRGSLVSPATVNKELRHLKAVLRIAHEWKYLSEVPKVRMLREPEKLPRYMTAEHFAAVYGACDVATVPEGLPYPAADWWRAFFTFAYMTGWRVSEPRGIAARRPGPGGRHGIDVARRQ